MADTTAKRERVAVLLASGATVRRAARVAGVGERSVHRWRTEPSFLELVNAHRRLLLDRTQGRLISMNIAAVRALMKGVRCPDPHVMLRAANSILDKALIYREATALEDRVTEIEAALKRRNSRRPQSNGRYQRPT
jgi:hypothetical protein